MNEWNENKWQLTLILKLHVSHCHFNSPAPSEQMSYKALFNYVQVFQATDVHPTGIDYILLLSVESPLWIKILI